LQFRYSLSGGWTRDILKASQVVLGHAKADVTQPYAERDLSKAHAIMAVIG
jgi:hypothetical protein